MEEWPERGDVVDNYRLLFEVALELYYRMKFFAI